MTSSKWIKEGKSSLTLLWDKACRRKQIRNLFNCFYFGLDYALIIKNKKGYLLVAKPVNQKLLVSGFETENDLQVAFNQKFISNNQSNREPLWSNPYYVYNMWLRERLDGVSLITQHSDDQNGNEWEAHPLPDSL